MKVSRRRLIRGIGSAATVAPLLSLAAACGEAGPASTVAPAAGGEASPSADAPTATASPVAVAPTPGLTPPEDRTPVPPNQRVVTRFPSLDLGYRPAVPPEDWQLELTGAVENPLTLSWEAFRALPRVQRAWGFHCVTGWSKLDVLWEGVLLQEIVALVRPREEVTTVVLEGRDGYTTNLIYRDVLAEEALLADTLEGESLTLEHGGPVRAVIPYLYGWKSCKFLKRVRFQASDEPGYWETRGYHNRGDPWREERFG